MIHPTVSGGHARGDAAAQLQALLPAVDRDAPRVAPARTNELRPLARLVAEVAGRVTGTGPPHIFTTLGQHPRLFRAWLRYSTRLMLLGELPRGDTELAILRVAWRCRSAYQWQQHVPIALRAGLTPGEVAGAAEERPAMSFTERQRAVLAVSDELVARRSLADPTWSLVRAVLNEHETIELCLLVGHYQGLASVIGGLGIQVEQARPAAGA